MVLQTFLLYTIRYGASYIYALFGLVLEVINIAYSLVATVFTFTAVSTSLQYYITQEAIIHKILLLHCLTYCPILLWNLQLLGLTLK